MDKTQDEFQFDGKTAVVTGGNGAIGQGIVEALVSRGANVAIADHAAPVSKPVYAGSERILDLRTDITDTDSVAAMVAKTIDKWGRIDVLVNNAGAGKGFAKILDVTDDDIEFLLDLNIRGTLNCTRAVVREMVAGGTGAIVNIASGAAYGGWAGHNDPVYAGCKGFMATLSRVLAMDLGQHNIRVNTVSPGWIVPETNAQMSEGSFWRTLGDTFGTPETFNRDFEEGKTLHATTNRALNRMGRPEDIANAVVYFASDAARHITGQMLSVCGGAYMPP